MITTAQAIQNYWGTSSLPALTSDGKLWYHEAPNQPVTPYAVLFQVAEPETARTTGSVVFEGVYQLNCAADHLADAEAMAAQVWNAFDHAPLVRDGQVMHCLTSSIHSMLGHQAGVDGKDCWIAMVVIEVLYTK